LRFGCFAVGRCEPFKARLIEFIGLARFGIKAEGGAPIAIAAFLIGFFGVG
jgi:hypothetical protein